MIWNQLNNQTRLQVAGLESSLRRFVFPWSEMERELSAVGMNRLPIVAYGSLMNPKSAGRDVSVDERRSQDLVWALGVRREFTYSMPQKFLDAWNVAPGSKSCAALNLSTGPVSEFAMNGVLLSVEFSDLANLRLREQDYDFIEVPVLSFSHPNAGIATAFTLVTPRSSPYCRYDILPTEGYKELCYEAAEQVSEEFLACYLQTTHLASGESLYETGK